MKRIIFAWLLALGLGPALLQATDTIYENTGSVTSPPDIAPNIDAFNFVNDGFFSINFAVPQQFKTRNTVNFTNYGTMSAQYGFDLETIPPTGSSRMAGTFYNAGTIDCGFDPVFLALPIRMIVWATNIINQGSINMSDGALLSLSSKNADLSRSSLIFDTGAAGTATLDSGVGVTPVTNLFTWNPAFSLTTTTASTPIFTNSVGTRTAISLSSSKPYSDPPFVVDLSNIVHRAIFLQNPNPDVKTSVLVDSSSSSGIIEWAAGVLDPATGAQVTNYLYLLNDFNFTTNFSPFPLGIGFQQSVGTPAFTGLTTPVTMPLLFNGNVSNSYEYVSVQITPTTFTTNGIVGYNVTNIPGRIQITSSNSLDLTLAQINGANYLSIISTNQYNGNEGSQIEAAYGDIKLGVTNGFLTISNLWKPSIPGWSGTVRAWNGRWFTITPTGVTNDFAVLVVDSALIPTAVTYLQDVSFHATNTLLLSDTLNVIRSFTADAQSLTLTTNEIGNGANSFDGELNIIASTFQWAASVPHVRWLTNNGALRLFSLNSQNFTNDTQGRYVKFINTGLLSDSGTFIWADVFLNAGVISNGLGGSFVLRCTNATMTNGFIVAGAGDIAISANTMVASNLTLRAGRTLTLSVTNSLSDTGVTNGNMWTVGTTNIFGGNYGMNLPVKPLTGDLLGTTITNIVSGANKQSWNVWAGQDRGISNSGYSNNVAVGRLILDAFGSSSQFTYTNATVNNALYVDYLELRDGVTNRDASGNFTRINNSNGLIIYYAQAMMNGVSIAEKMNHKNNDHLRWVPTYNGYFSSTNLVTGTTTNTINAALAQSTDIDSDGDGIPNALDPTPFFLPSDVNLNIGMTNIPPLFARLTFNTVPHATNFVYFSTNMVTWTLLTNFISPNLYPSPATNIVVLDPIGPVMRIYQVVVNTWLTYPF